MPLVGCCDGLVAVYANFNSASDVVNAVNLGWSGVADAGGSPIAGPPFTTPVLETGGVTEDQVIQNAYAQIGGTFWWLSFWTVSWPASGYTFYNAGYQGGQTAAQTIQNTFGSYMPAYVILDPEGDNTPASTAQEWADFINGYCDGVVSVNSSLRPAFYCNQSEYQTYNLGSVNHPAFIAVTPILNNSPSVSGPNISGFSAYYAACPAGQYVNQVISWHARWNTVQFSGSGVPCGPQ